MRTCLAPLFVLLLSMTVPARGQSSPPRLPPPIALGGECRLLASCPWSAPLGAHFRLGGFVWMGQAGDPRPISVLPFAALSASLWRWGEAGVMFTGRGGAPTDGGPALLQLPITLWARASPQLDTGSGLQTAAEIRYAIGRTPFDAGGTVYGDSESYALSVGYRKDRFEAFVTGAYQEAGARSYRGLEAGGGLYVMVWRAHGLQLGGEALGRFGGAGEGRDAAASWIAAAVVRSSSEQGISATLGGGAGGGPGMPGRVPLGFIFGMSFGPEYKPHPPVPGYESLGDAIEDWLRDRWKHRNDPVLPPLGLPPQPLPPMGEDPLGIRPDLHSGAQGPAPPYCGRLPGMPGRAVPLGLQRACLGATDTRLGGPLALRPGQAAPESPSGVPMGPPAPEQPMGPPRSPQTGIAQVRGGGPPTRTPGRGMPRTGLRYGRGAGHEDPETRVGEIIGGVAEPPFPPGGTGARPPVGEIPSIGPAGQTTYQPPTEPLPPGVRPESLPPWLRPAPVPARAAAAPAPPQRALAPLAPAEPSPAPRPAPATAPTEQPPARRGSSRAAAIDAAMPAPAPGPAFGKATRRSALSHARSTPDGVECAECGVPTPAPQVDHMTPRAKGGSNRITNADVLCPDCNLAKSDRPTVPWKTAPVDRRMPFVPRKR